MMVKRYKKTDLVFVDITSRAMLFRQNSMPACSIGFPTRGALALENELGPVAKRELVWQVNNTYSSVRRSNQIQRDMYI